MDASGQKERRCDDSQRSTAQHDPVSLHSLGDPESGQTHGGELVAELHLGGEAVDVKRRIDRFHFESTDKTWASRYPRMLFIFM